MTENDTPAEEELRSAIEDALEHSEEALDPCGDRRTYNGLVAAHVRVRRRLQEVMES